jgi:hypothetical protein
MIFIRTQLTKIVHDQRMKAASTDHTISMRDNVQIQKRHKRTSTYLSINVMNMVKRNWNHLHSNELDC